MYACNALTPWIKRKAPIVAVALLTICFHLSLHQLDEAVTQWVNKQVATYFGMSDPSLEEVLRLAWDWGLPAVLAVGILFAYHKWHEANLRRANMLSSQPHDGIAALPSSAASPRLGTRDVGKPDRVFVTITPKELRANCIGRTMTAAERLTAPFIGKWMKLSRPINDVSCKEHGSIVWLDDEESLISLHFEPSWNSRLDVLQIQESITAIGEIQEITQRYVRLR